MIDFVVLSMRMLLRELLADTTVSETDRGEDVIDKRNEINVVIVSSEINGP